MQAIISNRQSNTQGFLAEPSRIDNDTYWIRRGTKKIDDFAEWAPASAADISDQSQNAKTVMFVHGFNVDWAKCARTIEAINNGLGADYNVIAYDWCSAGNVLEYEQDRGRAKNSALHLMDAVSLLESPVVIAHSMGNYVVQCGLEQLTAQGDAGIFIDRWISVAADIDNTALIGKWAKVSHVRRGLVFYCATDGALDGSTALHLLEFNGLPRLGMTGPFVGCNPAHYELCDATWSLAHIVDPIAKHGAYFVEPFFYEKVKSFLGA